MQRLSHRDWESLVGALREVYAEADSKELPRTIVRTLRRLIPCGLVSYNEIDPRTNRALIVFDRDAPEVVEKLPAFEAHIPEHPHIRHYRATVDRHAYRTSDFLSHREFRELGIYQEFYRQVGVRTQLACLYSEGGATREVGIALNRYTGDFSDRDCLMLQLLKSHLWQAKLNAEMFTLAREQTEAVSEALDSLNRAVVLADHTGEIRWLMPASVQLLERYFPGAMKDAARLPEPLRRWVMCQLSGLGNGSVLAAPLGPFVVEGKDSRLTVRLQGEVGGSVRLLLSEERLAVSEASTVALGLTRRETEILHWITEAKSNPEIAIILRISHRTVHKHVQHLFEKLGVETRTAAARLGLELQGRQRDF
jgi:DNA-binding CsgD family transcriptional regulator